MKTPDMEFARIALALTAQAKIPADDKTLQAVVSTRAWLTKIAEGKLVTAELPPTRGNAIEAAAAPSP